MSDRTTGVPDAGNTEAPEADERLLDRVERSPTSATPAACSAEISG